MTDKNTSATKKASVATKKPVAATPAPPKAEVNFSLRIIHFSILKINRK
jgi:hypothetical protein